jgi:predicted nucleotidyltransferase
MYIQCTYVIRKTVVKSGNAAGICLPKTYLGRTVEIKIIDKTMDEILLELIQNYGKEIQGIYLTGSKARGDHTKESDTDLLIITNKTNKVINEGNYEIRLLDLKTLYKKRGIEKLTLLSMIQDAKSILNQTILDQIKEITINKTDIQLALKRMQISLNHINQKINEAENKSVENISYSIILLLRMLTYIVNKNTNNKNIQSYKEIYKEYQIIKQNESHIDTIQTQKAKEALKEIHILWEKAKKLTSK